VGAVRPDRAFPTGPHVGFWRASAGHARPLACFAAHIRPRFSAPNRYCHVRQNRRHKQRQATAQWPGQTYRRADSNAETGWLANAQPKKVK
jgi:hypothetical protein